MSSDSRHALVQTFHVGMLLLTDDTDVLDRIDVLNVDRVAHTVYVSGHGSFTPISDRDQQEPECRGARPGPPNQHRGPVTVNPDAYGRVPRLPTVFGMMNRLEIAKLVLDYVQALTWPTVILRCLACALTFHGMTHMQAAGLLLTGNQPHAAKTQ